MRISLTRQFLLFHIPRTGGSSIIAALDGDLFVRAAPTIRNKLMSKCLFFVPRPIERTYLRTHETARHVRRLLPADRFTRYTKIAFVRNPYSWLVSLYELVLQSPTHRHYERVKAMNGFSEYVDWEISRGKRKQYPYICDRNGRLLIDKLGRFERLADDAARIFESIGVEIAPLRQVGRFTRRDYRESYDEPTRRMVEAHWARDLELFGYAFDGPLDDRSKQASRSRYLRPMQPA